MKKDSLIIFTVSIVLTLGIVGGAHYLNLQKQKRVPDLVSIQPSSTVRATQTGAGAIPPANYRTATPIKCKKSDGTVFWTNATRCEGADLNNRLSYADPVKPIPRVKTNRQRKNATSQGSPRVSQSSQRSPKSIPSDMVVACSFPIGMARKIEKKSLRLKDDPADSLWKDSYCRWVCEARQEECERIGDYLEFERICPGRVVAGSRCG